MLTILQSGGTKLLLLMKYLSFPNVVNKNLLYHLKQYMPVDEEMHSLQQVFMIFDCLQDPMIYNDDSILTLQ